MGVMTRADKKGSLKVKGAKPGSLYLVSKQGAQFLVNPIVDCPPCTQILPQEIVQTIASNALKPRLSWNTLKSMTRD